ncbi:hypothetical protein H6F77_26295 [Microcoleus sp. FACHB-831]|uniref:hypothetical protein n=1 Tax=Microcoleus sp. FACHB-831 TaxID=2692827 RepID=UPI001681FEE6|nr:hypothetical protein [Microcoleus sp. FACHB-831]MBD1924547.1 hypothetical protein [Microcoleus sp. FACHB-831]
MLDNYQVEAPTLRAEDIAVSFDAIDVLCYVRGIVLRDAIKNEWIVRSPGENVFTRYL